MPNDEQYAYIGLHIQGPAWYEVPLYNITMPCGTTVSYHERSDVPRVDTPCPCGNPLHWILRINEPFK